MKVSHATWVQCRACFFYHIVDVDIGAHPAYKDEYLIYAAGIAVRLYTEFFAHVYP
ncbi:hypothetical protein D3C85_1827170 [compost metagenome]